ncbi:MAG: CBS domain-containing protein [Dehalococcoidales bacterium]|nr:CBS domain-containing protein [Dehalococcoidales bacterium]
MSGVPVKEIMDSHPETISPDTSVADLVHNVFVQHRRRAAPVTQGERLLGIVTLTDVKELPQQKWAQTTVDKIMTREPLYSVDTSDDLNSALKLLAKHDLNQVVVVHEGQLVGLLNRADIIRYLQVNQELSLGTSKRPS